MPGFFFDIKNGHRLVDAAGVDCDGDAAARKQGIAIANAIAAEVPKSGPAALRSGRGGARSGDHTDRRAHEINLPR